MSGSRRCLAVVLAAGEGTRMRSDTPKVLHRLAGRSMLGHVLGIVAEAGAEAVVVVVGPGRDDVAAEARRAWATAVASQQLATYAEQVKDAADASSELARRMARAGNFSRLAQMREQTFYAEATAQLARARHQATADREKLIRVLGLWGASTQFKLPERLVAPR